MRALAWFARHPRLRTGLVVIAVAFVAYGGARLWTSGPDAVHITITHVDGSRLPHFSTSVTYDRTVHSSAVAQRLQRDLAAMPLANYFGTYVCPAGNATRSGTSVYDPGSTYDTYTLTWFRAGLPFERASVERTGCAFWFDDGVFVHVPVGGETMYADIEAVVTASG